MFPRSRAKAKTQMGEFGDKFRKQREKKELSFDDVSNVIKISSRMLQAIEAENFDQLPGGVFNKGFIRAYAKQLGLDPEEAIADYLACIRPPQPSSQQTWQPESPVAAPAKVAVAPSPKTAKKSQAPVEVSELPNLHLPRAEDVRPPRRSFAENPPGIPWKFVAVGAVLLILITILWTRHHRAIRVESKSGAASTSAPAVTAATPGATSSPSAPNSQTQPLQSEIPAADIEDKTEDKSDVTIRNFGKPLPKSTEKAVGSFALVIRATENSWISVVADGQVVTEETLIAPAHTTVHASREIVVKVGNAGGITFLFNGKDIAAQGNEAEVKTLVFDANGLKEAPGTPAPAPIAN